MIMKIQIRMRYRIIKKRIMKKLENHGMNNNDYTWLRKLYVKQFNRRPPVIHRTNREKIIDAVPVLEKILQDPETAKLFNQVVANPAENIGSTRSLMRFLHEITK